MKVSFSNLLKSIDSFGHPIQVNYKGEETFKSQVGGLLSLLSLALTLVLVVRAVNEMVVMEEPTLKEFSKLLQLEDRNELVPVRFSDYDLIFMFESRLESINYEG